MSDDLLEPIPLKEESNDDPREMIDLIQHTSKASGEIIRLIRHGSDDPGESTHLNEHDSDDVGQSIRLIQHEHDDSGESIHLKQDDSDLGELIRLIEHNSGDPAAAIHLNEHDSDYSEESNRLNQHDSDNLVESLRSNEHSSDDPGESISLNKHGRDNSEESISLNKHDSDYSEESISLNKHDSDYSEESKSLNKHDSDYSEESKSLNKHGSDDPGESISLNKHGSDDPGESISLNNHGSDDPGESIISIQHDHDDPGKPMSLNEHDIDPGESIHLNQENNCPRSTIHLSQHNSIDLRESIRPNLNSDNPREWLRLDQYYSDLVYTRKRQVRPDISFTTSAVGLIELSNVVYKKLCEVSPQFSESVSSSMFMYYVSQLHHMRVCCLQWKITKPEAPDLRLMNIVIQRNSWIIPQLLADYFNSIGSFRDSTGILAQHREIVYPSAFEIDGIRGYYGRVGSNTHAYYENRISPGVAAKRILQDILFTVHPLGRLQKGNWNLPQILLPEEENAGGPTGNLLGWSPATALTPEQIRVLNDCGIYLNQDKFLFSHYTRFCYNHKLMIHISACLKELSGRVKCVERLSTSPTGSIVQHDFQMVGTHGNLPRTYVYGDISTYSSGSAPLHMHQELLAHVFRLRIFRRKMEQSNEITVNPWCCYDFKGYREVPESWCNTSNCYFYAGRRKMWDFGWYRTEPEDLRPLLNGLMAKTLIQ